MTKRTLIILGVIVLILTMVVVVTYFSLFGPSLLQETEVNFERLELEDQSCRVEGFLLSSGKSYRSYKYDIKDGALKLKLYGGLVNNKHSQGRFSILIQDDLSKVHTIVLVDKTGEHVIYTP